MIAAEDGSWLERRTGDDPHALGRELAALGTVRDRRHACEAQADTLVGRLEALGHAVVRCPLIRIEPLGDDPVDPAAYDWVVVTSRNGAHELARRLVFPAAPAWRRSAAGTADALREQGLRGRPRAARLDAGGAARGAPRPAASLLAAAEGARRLLVDERGADFLPLYRTVELGQPPPEGDLALLASASAARAFAATGARIPVVAIGPQTAAEAREHGLRGRRRRGLTRPRRAAGRR